jgi:dipeptide/tripeptide permease
MEVALVSIPAQTTLQDDSPPEVRGRVFAVLFTISNLVAIPPMLTIGNLADRIGIPRVTLLVAALVMLIAVWSIWYGRRTGAWEAARARRAALTANPHQGNKGDDESAPP